MLENQNNFGKNLDLPKETDRLSVNDELLMGTLVAVSEFNLCNSMYVSAQRIFDESARNYLLENCSGVKISDFDNEIKRISNNYMSVFLTKYSQNYREISFENYNPNLVPYVYENMNREKIKQVEQGGEIAFFQGANLLQIGLSLNLVDEDTDHTTLTFGERKYKNKNIAFRLTNGDKFLNFLGQLDDGFLSTSTGMFKKLDSVFLSLGDQLLYHDDLAHPNDEVLELLTNMEKLASEYQRLGGKAFVGFDDCLAVKKQGFLREYVTAYRRGWLPDKGKKEKLFSLPLTYSTNRLYNEWNQVMTDLRKIPDNPQASDFYEQLKLNLIGYVNSSLEMVGYRHFDRQTEDDYNVVLYTVKKDLMES